MSFEDFPVLINKHRINNRINELALEIIQGHPESNPILLLVIVLKGSIPFAVDLMRSIQRQAPHIDVRFEIIGAGSYRGTQSTGAVTIYVKPDKVPKGCRPILVEDVIDTGRTIYALLNWFADKFNTTPKVCALLDKPGMRTPELKTMRPDYCGFPIGDEFAIGMGLDLDEQYRGLEEIRVYKE